MDKLRRFIFTISAEGASYFEWSIWSSLIIAIIGMPVVIAILESVLNAVIIVILTIVIMFIISFLIVGIADSILQNWPFEISDEELQYEKNYVPRIPND